ncbi:MAG: flagellar motor protein MotB [Pseudomonadota bacterium]
MADGQSVVIKKVKKVSGDGHHGGAWKVAYADFVTAMMAFFLLMWLLGATTEDQRKGIADYFNPTVPIIQVSGGGKDALNGESVFSEKTLARDGAGGSRTPLDQSPDGKQAIGVESDTPSDGGADAPPSEDLAKVQETILRQALAEGAGGLAEHIKLRVTNRGLVIELVEVDDQPLFRVGSREPSAVMQQLLQIVASALTLVENDIEIDGHTDSLTYARRADYTNWELSSDRANMARRLIVQSGFDPIQIKAVTGKANTQPLNEDDPTAPENRRISITLLRD